MFKPSQPQSKSRRSAAWSGAKFFGLWGPAIGMLIVVAGSWIDAWGSNAVALMIFLPLAYVIGLVPALLTGVTVGLMYEVLQRRRHGYLWTGLLSALWTLLYLFGIRMSQGRTIQLERLETIAVISVFGGLAGAMCGWRFLRSLKNEEQTG